MVEINPYKRFILILALCFIPFVAARIGLLFTYQDDFNELTSTQIGFAFLHGLRFDASTISLFIGLPLLLTLLPYNWARSVYWQGLCLWSIFIAILVINLVLIADFIYFGFVRRHVGPEINLLTDDASLMIDIAITDHGLSILAFAIVAIIFGLIWKKLFFKSINAEHKPLFRYSLIAVIFICFIIAGRGGFQYKPVKASDAFSGGSAAQGYLTLNGAFAATHAIRGSAPKNIQFMAKDEALDILKNEVVSANEVLLDEERPILRQKLRKELKQANNSNSTRPNIVFLMVESFDAIHFDFLRKLNNQQLFGSTLVMDKLAKDGIVFSRFFATGQRSMDGLAATLAGVPTLPGQPYIGKGLEQNRLSFLGHMAKSQGYQTYFIQTSNRGSFHIDSIAAQSGFENYYGAEDIPPAHTDAGKASEWGVWDHDTLQFSAKIFHQAEEPFIGYIFTSTTHNPWRVPKKQWEKNPKNSDRNKYLNSLYYLDWAIGEFMKKSRTSSYFNNTIFIITGDHISRFGVDTDNLESRFHLPLIIYSPSKKYNLVKNTIGNQMDIIPTIIDLAGWDVAHSSMGRSLLDTTTQRFSFSVSGEIINYIDDNQWISHNLTNTVFKKSLTEHAKTENAEKKLLGFYQAANTLIMENKVYR